ncbi:hypothetical protein PUN49_26600 [Pseudomonas extremaustralis]|uniref:hypothetical protein n=1 Tax=Pseudomonas extremaustralis TaxID=359110 RepID=UPI00240F6EFB|nr:hypothetical protein [Pseudomonas extremaustralis]MDG2970572.1 hypothetical protein [Pseudomonas extremaustralis]
MLAKIVNDNASLLADRGVFEVFASKLAPTGGGVKPIQCCSELFIVNRPIVQLFSRECSFLFTPEHAACAISL